MSEQFLANIGARIDELEKKDAEVISIKDYFDEKFLANDKALVLALQSLMIRLESIDKATEVAKISMEKRLEGMNEFRDALKDAQTQYVTKREHDLIQADIRILRESKAVLEGKADQKSVNVAFLVSFIGLFVSAISFLIRFIH